MATSACRATRMPIWLRLMELLAIRAHDLVARRAHQGLTRISVDFARVAFLDCEITEGPEEACVANGPKYILASPMYCPGA